MPNAGYSMVDARSRISRRAPDAHFGRVTPPSALPSIITDLRPITY
ncbi:MAG TPA: hypothetical protein VL486_14175 [Verrucomicrobiae bacterium]|nr:hypothetical protein [Verrucomicrobiae bacterium]